MGLLIFIFTVGVLTGAAVGGYFCWVYFTSPESADAMSNLSLLANLSRPKYLLQNREYLGCGEDKSNPLLSCLTLRHSKIAKKYDPILAGELKARDKFAIYASKIEQALKKIPNVSQTTGWVARLDCCSRSAPYVLHVGSLEGMDILFAVIPIIRGVTMAALVAAHGYHCRMPPKGVVGDGWFMLNPVIAPREVDHYAAYLPLDQPPYENCLLPLMRDYVLIPDPAISNGARNQVLVFSRSPIAPDQSKTDRVVSSPQARIWEVNSPPTFLDDELDDLVAPNRAPRLIDCPETFGSRVIVNNSNLPPQIDLADAGWVRQPTLQRRFRGFTVFSADSVRDLDELLGVAPSEIAKHPSAVNLANSEYDRKRRFPQILGRNHTLYMLKHNRCFFPELTSNQLLALNNQGFKLCWAKTQNGVFEGWMTFPPEVDEFPSSQPQQAIVNVGSDFGSDSQTIRDVQIVLPEDVIDANDTDSAWLDEPAAATAGLIPQEGSVGWGFTDSPASEASTPVSLVSLDDNDYSSETTAGELWLADDHADGLGEVDSIALLNSFMDLLDINPKIPSKSKSIAKRDLPHYEVLSADETKMSFWGKLFPRGVMVRSLTAPQLERLGELMVASKPYVCRELAFSGWFLTRLNAPIPSTNSWEGYEESDSSSGSTVSSLDPLEVMAPSVTCSGWVEVSKVRRIGGSLKQKYFTPSIGEQYFVRYTGKTYTLLYPSAVSRASEQGLCQTSDLVWLIQIEGESVLGKTKYFKQYDNPDKLSFQKGERLIIPVSSLSHANYIATSVLSRQVGKVSSNFVELADYALNQTGVLDDQVAIHARWTHKPRLEITDYPTDMEELDKGRWGDIDHWRFCKLRELYPEDSTSQAQKPLRLKLTREGKDNKVGTFKNMTDFPVTVSSTNDGWLFAIEDGPAWAIALLPHNVVFAGSPVRLAPNSTLLGESFVWGSPKTMIIVEW